MESVLRRVSLGVDVPDIWGINSSFSSLGGVRYGLPVNFQAMLLQPHKKNMKKLREVLYELYKHLDSSAAIIDVSEQLEL